MGFMALTEFVDNVYSVAKDFLKANIVPAVTLGHKLAITIPLLEHACVCVVRPSARAR